MPNLTTFRTANGIPFTVSADHAPNFQGLLNDLEARGYGIRPTQSGGYANRNIAGTNKLSQHAHGNAVDINWEANARGTRGEIDPAMAEELASKWGMTWGGKWKNPDPMHFEIAGGAAPHPAMPQGTMPTPQPPSAPQPGAGPMPQRPNDAPQQPGFWDQAYGRLTNPLTMGGLGMLVAASEGRNSVEGMQAGLQSGIGLQRQNSDMAEKNRAAMRQKIMDEFWQNLPNNKALSSRLPPEIMELAGALPSGKRGEFVTDFVTKRATTENPSSVREWEYFNKLPQDQQGNYLRMKRAAPWLDTGTEFTQPNPVNPNQPPRTIEKNVAGEESQKIIGRTQGENTANMPKASAALRAANSKTKIVRDAIASLEPMISNWTVGPGEMLAKVPGTAARDVKAKLDVIGSNLAFEELQDMRNNSPTGGALGAISERELQLLQSTKAALDQAQTVGEFQKALGELKKILTDAEVRRQQAYEDTYKQKFDAGPATPGGGWNIKRLD